MSHRPVLMCMWTTRATFAMTGCWGWLAPVTYRSSVSLSTYRTALSPSALTCIPVTAPLSLLSSFPAISAYICHECISLYVCLQFVKTNLICRVSFCGLSQCSILKSAYCSNRMPILKFQFNALINVKWFNHPLKHHQYIFLASWIHVNVQILIVLKIYTFKI